MFMVNASDKVKNLKLGKMYSINKSTSHFWRYNGTDNFGGLNIAHNFFNPTTNLTIRFSDEDVDNFIFEVPDLHQDNNSGDSHVCEFVDYIGFTQQYRYCKICDKKE